MQQKLSDFVAEVKKDRMAGARAAQRVKKSLATDKNARGSKIVDLNGVLPAYRGVIKDFLRQVPEKYQRLYLKAMTGHSLKAATKINCLGCVCWQRTEVRDCQITHCEFHPYRPYRTKACVKQ